MNDSKEIQLGFAEEESAEWLTNRYFPSKVGGKPAWLDCGALPTQEHMICKKCELPKAFICQIYAPLEEHDRCFHRTIYVFMCRTKECQVRNNADNVTVLRSQLAVKNDYFSVVPPDDGPDEPPLPPVPTRQKICYLCGCPGALECKNCKNINYCSALHRTMHLPHHKDVCQNPTDIHNDGDILSKVLFQEYEIGMADKKDMDEGGHDAHDEDKDDDEERETEKERIAEYEKLLAAGKTGTLQNVPEVELNKYFSIDDEDVNFTNFKKIVSKHPYQIIRYNLGDKPLWITGVEQVTTKQLDNLPKCELCGGIREFEFQVMPSLLTLLKDDHLDWGVLAVYTCKNSCEIKGYVPEVVIKQDI